ncbi:hypothetical protein CDL15_Pgr011268 [Punica granatum]|uniref:Uncharacterized protein n=1 Tax=Punica granatum TaxID=22663 RepID=A0A218WFY9_PUNGR|nr:hypothetical protein CDL15_Pgr011268 [Punica granatum]
MNCVKFGVGEPTKAATSEEKDALTGVPASLYEDSTSLTRSHNETSSRRFQYIRRVTSKRMSLMKEVMWSWLTVCKTSPDAIDVV